MVQVHRVIDQSRGGETDPDGGQVGSAYLRPAQQHKIIESSAVAHQRFHDPRSVVDFDAHTLKSRCIGLAPLSRAGNHRDFTSELSQQFDHARHAEAPGVPIMRRHLPINHENARAMADSSSPIPHRRSGRPMLIQLSRPLG